tara:strand:- start:1017 stop:1619 length:603 start_codon:yes stop_codon:yes gene_type:complete
MERKKKLRLIQLTLLLLGSIIIFFTYYKKETSLKEPIIPEATQEKIKKQLAADGEDGDVFFNISYSGLDLAGNRYILKSKEASNSKENQETVNMKYVEANFYFKDDTILKVMSDTGVYNNKTLDMVFEGNVKANYEGSKLLAQKADYSNTRGLLIISDKVKVIDSRGTIVADNLSFDIKNQKLNIASFNDDKINANIKLK